MVHILRRLTKRSQFLILKQKGQKIVMPSFVLQFAPVAVIEASLSQDEKKNCSDSIYVGYVVTRKLGNAVMRNRIKRRMKAVVSELFPESGCTGYACVLIGRYHINEYDYAGLRQQFNDALARVNSQHMKKAYMPVKQQVGQVE